MLSFRRSYAQNGSKLKLLYLLAEINAAEFDWLILANQIQATWSGMSVIVSAEKKLAEVIENKNLSQIIELISRFFL